MTDFIQKIASKKILFTFAVFFFIFSVPDAFAWTWGQEACLREGGNCDSYVYCSDGFEQIGNCGMTICCKSVFSGGTIAPTTCNDMNGSCRGIVTESGSTCNDDEDYRGAGLGCPAGQGCCTPKNNPTSPTNPQAPGSSSPQNPSGPAGSPGSGTGSPSQGTGINPRNQATGGLVPCTDNCTLCHLVIGFKNIYDYLLYTILFPATVMGIVISGIMYMVSSGSKTIIEKAKTAFTYSLTAMILALLAWLIINATLNALGFKNAGNWWNFTCDTTQTQGPAGGGASSSSNVRPGQAVTNTEKGDGTCGGTVGLVSDKSNCNVTSKRLDDVLSCIKGRMAFGEDQGPEKVAIIKLFVNEAFAAGRLNISIGIGQSGHVTNSCHYGGRRCQGQANAADLTGDLSSIRDAAVSCGADSVIHNRMAYFGGNSRPYTGSNPHTGHVHISVNNAACGCDYLQ